MRPARVNGAVFECEPPIILVCWANTHNNHMADNAIGIANIFLNVVIHGPGFGNIFWVCGTKHNKRYGNANPNPNIAKMINDMNAFCVNANPIAVAMNGAVHGVATTMAKTPVKKDDFTVFPLVIFDPMDAKRPPTLNTPHKFKATATNRVNNPNIKNGFCSWNPHPIRAPVLFKNINNPATNKRDRITPMV